MDYLRQAGLKAAARSALRDARTWFEQALGVLDALPESQSTLEQAFEIRLELRPVLAQLGEVRLALERLREAEALAERLNDDRRRGRVCAFMTTAHNNLGELDEALVTGTRALEIARAPRRLEASPRHDDLSRAGALLPRRLRAGDRAGHRKPRGTAHRLDLRVLRQRRTGLGLRSLLARSALAALGRFTEATAYETDAIRLAQTTQHANTVGMAHYAAGVLHLLKGDWAKARAPIERGLAVSGPGTS